MKKFFLIPLLTLVCSVMAWAEVETLTTADELRTFLTKAGTAEGVLTASVDITNEAIVTQGDKTLTLNDDVVVTYKRFSGTYVDNINVPAGAKLTILGNGTFVGNNRAVATVGGELVVGPQDKSTQPHFVSTRTDAGCVIQANSGLVTINNADVYAGAIALWTKNGGRLIVNDGRFEAECAQTVNVAANSYYEQNGGTFINNTSTKHGTYSYTIMVQGHAVFNDGFVSGVHGGVDVSYWQATAEINGGTYETRPCIYGGASHYALYASTYGVATVRGGKFKSADKKAVFCGNNDAFSEIGVVNIYGGEFATKAYVQYAPTNTFPASVPTTSQWYSSFGTDAPLPAGYEYYDITEGEDYEAGYRYGVRPVPGKEADAIDADQKAAQDANPEYTIPWQQATTWASDEVPVENTIVTIPVDATVTVSKDETTKTAVADQVYVAQGATLKVEDGTTLTVGEGGMNIGNGGKLIVEPGAIVKVGDAGIITTDNQALVIEATETDQAVLLYDPNVPQNENTQPKATVKLTTKSKMLNNSPYQYTYQRFALPIKAAATPVNDFDPAIHEYYDATEESYGFESYIYYWNSHNWANCNWSALVPFKGYQLANNSKNGGVVYTFKGNLLGNEDGEYNFAEYGFDFFGNSYTAPINVETFLNGFGSDVEATIWLYNYTTTNWQHVSLEDFEDGFVDDEYKQIKSMDGFLLNLRAASGSANVNYNDAIWSNPLLGTSPSLAPARRVANSNLSNSAVITVTEANGHGDAVTLVEKATRSNEFENGADASKYMTEDGLSLYAETNAGQLSRVATNDLSNTVLTFRAGNETNYSLTIDKAQGEDYILRDNVTGNTIALANGATYNFTQAANTTVPARFEVIGIAKAPTAIDNIEEAAKISGIYTITGQFLGHDFTNLPAGVYVVNGVKIVK